MLVLSRHSNQGIVAPDLGISIRILSVNGTKVKVGIDAPRNVRFLRSELAAQGTSAMRPASPVPDEIQAELHKVLGELSSRLNDHLRRESTGDEPFAMVSSEEMYRSIVSKLDAPTPAALLQVGETKTLSPVLSE